MTSLHVGPIEFRQHSGQQARQLLPELAIVFAEVYAEPPYHMGEDEVALFRERFEIQHQQLGFSLVTARAEGTLVGFILGVPLPPTSTWWSRLLAPLPSALTEERPGRTFALIELVVRAPWRRQGIARRLHDMVLRDRTEERATLTARPEAEAAQAAYSKWGWRKVGQKRNPLPGNPVYDILIKPLRQS